jgi:pyruvate/2-oxoglutarate dehydrogenase complex dihydrolipoamide dehydrogenase (E3) component
VRRALERDGVRFVLGARVERASRDGATVRLETRAHGAVVGDALLVAAGRTPNVEGLGLESAGVRVARDGSGVEVDDRLRTSNRRIFAAGDVCSRWKFTHAADAMARIVVQNALLPIGRRASALVIPWCTYTDPEVAHVGIGEDDARARPRTFTTRVASADVDRAVLDSIGDDEGYLDVRADARSGRVLGATWVGRHAGENIAEVVLAMTAGLSLGAVDATIHPYPTRADALRRAASAWRRTKLTPRAAAILRQLIRWRR